MSDLPAIHIPASHEIQKQRQTAKGRHQLHPDGQAIKCARHFKKWLESGTDTTFRFEIGQDQYLLFIMHYGEELEYKGYEVERVGGELIVFF